MTQFDMFADTALPAREPDQPRPKEYMPVAPYGPRPEGAADAERWILRTHRRNLLDMVRALDSVRATRDLFDELARSYLVRLGGMGA